MSNYIPAHETSTELYHYGVKGMKWGKRMARGHAGPGMYTSKKRRYEGDKRDLETLNKGGHLSVGLTKKRQAALDKRDKSAIEKRIAKYESDQQYKATKKAANKAIREAKERKVEAKYKKHGLDYNVDTMTNVYMHGWKGAKRIEDNIKNKKMSRLKAESIEIGRSTALATLNTIGLFGAIALAGVAAEKNR